MQDLWILLELDGDSWLQFLLLVHQGEVGRCEASKILWEILTKPAKETTKRNALFMHTHQKQGCLATGPSRTPAGRSTPWWGTLGGPSTGPRTSTRTSRAGPTARPSTRGTPSSSPRRSRATRCSKWDSSFFFHIYIYMYTNVYIHTYMYMYAYTYRHVHVYV